MRINIRKLLLSFLVLCIPIYSQVGSSTTFTLGSSSGNPSAGHVRLWANSSSGKLECLNSSGTSCLGVVNPCVTTGAISYYSAAGSSIDCETDWTISAAHQLTGNIPSATGVAGTTSFLSLQSMTSTQVAGADYKMRAGSSTVSGEAQAGSTWSTEYDNATFNLTSGNLTHGLLSVKRLTGSSSIGTSIDALATGYYTADLTGFNGTLSTFNALSLLTGGTLDGSGTVDAYAGLSIATPVALSGGLTLNANMGVTIADVAGAGAGTSRADLSLAGSISGGLKAAIFIGPPGSTIDNAIYASGSAYFSGGFLAGISNVFWNSGAYSSADRLMQVAANNTNTPLTFYNGTGGWDIGLSGGMGATRFGFIAASGTEVMTILADGKVGIGQIAPSITGLTVTGTVLASIAVQTTTMAVGSLPACTSGIEGTLASVNNSNAASFAAGIGTTVAAGGTLHVPVYCDGTNWRIG